MFLGVFKKVLTYLLFLYIIIKNSTMKIREGTRHLVVMVDFDPEALRAIKIIERIRNSHDVDYVLAAYRGKKCLGSDYAYKADSILYNDGKTVVKPGELSVENIYFFECHYQEIQKQVAYYKRFVFDHHKPGDPGYNIPIEEYQHGSSLGQLMMAFGLPLSEEDRYVSALDHALPFALNGLCPGIEQSIAIQKREEHIARNLVVVRRRKGERVVNWLDVLEELRVDIAYATTVIQQESSVFIRPPKSHSLLHDETVGVRMYDLSKLKKSRAIQQLNEAACRMGIAYIVDYIERDGKRTIKLKGLAFPWLVERFKQVIGEEHIIIAIPQRGFAKAVVPADFCFSIQDLI